MNGSTGDSMTRSVRHKRGTTMPALYEDHDEEALHQSVVEALAQEIQQPVANVKSVYEDEFARLKSNAKVRDYLALLCSRRAREKLLRKRAA
jgi:Protein of unknown function (DUF3562)